MASKQANAKLALRITSGIFRWILNALFYIILVMCIITFSRAAYDFSYQVFGDVTVDEAPGIEYKVRIVSGESTMSLASKLEMRKIIVDKNTFYLKAKLAKVNIMPGTYIVSSAMTYEEIFDELSDVNNSLTTEEYQEEEGSKEGSTEKDQGTSEGTDDASDGDTQDNKDE